LNEPSHIANTGHWVKKFGYANETSLNGRHFPAQGNLLVMDIMGNTVGRVNLRSEAAISDLTWNCERFSMEEQDEASGHATSGNKRPDGKFG
jgi:hypothetical protein